MYHVTRRGTILSKYDILDIICIANFRNPALCLFVTVLQLHYVTQL